MSIPKSPIYFILILIFITSVSASLQDLLNSYSYNFYNGTINVTSQSDYMIDKNNNNKNDTLIINVTTDKSEGTYRFIAEITDENGILINSTEKTLSISGKSAGINFPSELLSKQKFNYSIRINDNDNNLIFRKYNIESQSYRNYENGINITKITDENANNNFIRINLTIYSNTEKTVNITVTLSYNSSTISKTEEKSIGSGIQAISTKFDNETIKTSHYNGKFIIDKVIVGNKLFYFNQNTSFYNYEDFAKTPYIKSIADGIIDSNNNNLSEFLEINFTVGAKEKDNYTVSYELYDQYDNFAANFSKTETLNTGQNIMQTLINGSEIYKTKVSGPYSLSFAKLSIGNDVKDIIFNAHTTGEIFYTDFEKPNLPDLKLAMHAVFNNAKNIVNITVNLSNIGNAPAFNIFLDIFSNKTYQNNKTLAFLDKNNFIVYNFAAENSSNDTLFTAIADFDNLVDEANEENNIINSLAEEKNDFDNDGIDDKSDTLIGNINSINTTISNLTIKIGNYSDLLQAFNGTWKISFEDNISMLMEFDYNLSKMLNLTKIRLEKQSNASFGYTIIHGLSLQKGTKTVYVDRVNTAINGICIRDAAVTEISQITENCNNANETKIECDGTLQSSYACSYNSTTAKYKITGLNNSGVKQINYAKPANSESGSLGDGGNSGSSGSSGSCLEKWGCSGWLECNDRTQTRYCKDDNKCGSLINKPITKQECDSIIKTNKEELGTRLKTLNNNKGETKNNEYSLPKISGFFTAPPKESKIWIGMFLIFVILTSGLSGYFYYLYKD